MLKIPTIPAAFHDQQKVPENWVSFDHEDPALPDEERAEWSRIALAQYWPIGRGFSLDCQIIFSHKQEIDFWSVAAGALSMELIAELALVLLLRESFPEASIGRPISLRQPPGEKSCGAGRRLFSFADSFHFLSPEGLQEHKLIKWEKPFE